MVGGVVEVAGDDTDPNREAPVVVAALDADGDPNRDVILPAWKLVPAPPKMLEAGLLVATGAPPMPMPPKKEVVDAVVLSAVGAALLAGVAAGSGAAAGAGAVLPAATGVMVTELPSRLCSEVTLGVGSNPGLGDEEPPMTITGELGAGGLGEPGTEDG